MASGRSRIRLLRQALSPEEWRRLGRFYAVIGLLHVVGFGLFFWLILPRNIPGLAIGGALLAYSLGLRHAFDADHIAAIDNTTRKLMADGKRPLGVGFFFSLGHSSVVFLLTFLVAVLVGVAYQVKNGDSPLHSAGFLIGTGVSGGFLYLIGALNLVILIGVVRVFRAMRRGEYDEMTLEEKLSDRGLMNRFLGPLARSIKASWQMYPIGFLFGLGFDTTTEVAYLFLAGAAAAAGLPWYAILCLPIIFAAGMSLMDTADGAFMAKAYGWAFSKPVRKVYYNLTITGLSVVVAFLIGTIELLSVLAAKLNLSGGLWDLVAGVDLNKIGFLIVAIFVVTWVGALGIWRFGRIEQRWALAPSGPPAALAPARPTARVSGDGYTALDDSREREGVA